MSLHEHTNASQGSTGPKVPLLRPEGDTPYAVWRPLILTHMMRVGIEERHFTKVIKDWVKVDAAVLAVAESDEQAAMDLLLGNAPAEVKDEPSASSGSGKAPAAPTEEQKTASADARKLMGRLVAQSRKAFGILHEAIDVDVRALIGGVPQGYAFGLWSLLEERFQSQKDDNIADVWARFVSLSQDAGEAYDSYMARVDKDLALLKAAKQEVPSGLRKMVLLYRLQPMYALPCLALQTSQRIEQSENIDWIYVKGFMGDHEREQGRADPANDVGARAMAARGQSAWNKQPQTPSTTAASNDDRPRRDMSKVECWDCHKFGHTSRFCKERKGKKNISGPRDSDKRHVNKEVDPPDRTTMGRLR